MWRYRFLIKGSAQELTWLNQLAQKGWLLAQIRGNWYHFRRTKVTYRLFSEYVPTELMTTVAPGNQLFSVLATVQVKKPAIQIVYTGSPQAVVQAIRLSPGDASMRLKVALSLRDRALNTMNLLIYLGVGFFGLLIFTMDSDLQLILLTVYGAIGIYVVLRFAKATKNLQAQIMILRRATADYDGAWLPTMHVFLTAMPSDLALEPVASLGRWTLVGHSHNGTYWYDLQTLASAAEIKQTLQPFLPATTQVNVISWLGLAPLGWVI
ncbi:hypothetical protein C5Z26_08775 [Lactobacillus sp. CBA3606]|uniref:hypothetical protein n=1 Tax=Lactobacillus sp. CBA3606 TaxID=2099789 RepID=UPI000CFC05BC|nr:hypothetical protein [Lactobacillus sp. CBA3606]AVK64198.1 hypothetical protein C5Z26_08775 [Lactobacillus sp. CBA3606]